MRKWIVEFNDRNRQTVVPVETALIEAENIEMAVSIALKEFGGGSEINWGFSIKLLTRDQPLVVTAEHANRYAKH